MTSRNNTLLDQGLNCITILALGISNAPFIPRDLRFKLAPVILAAMVLALLVYLCQRARHSEEDRKREQKDERNRMLQEKAVWYCYRVEDWVLLGLYIWFMLFLQRGGIAYTIWWLLIVRSLLSFGIRWWLNRKY